MAELGGANPEGEAESLAAALAWVAERRAGAPAASERAQRIHALMVGTAEGRT